MNRVITSQVGDIALAAAVAAGAMAEVWLPLPSVLGDGSRLVSSAVALVACAALALRRTRPLVAALVALLVWPLAH